jgi:hypothetical protein
VWDHKPSADELLDGRFAAGWTPTPSLLKVGPTVLGHAACRVPGDTSCRTTDASA